MSSANDVVGIISDTHGLLRDEVIAQLQGCSSIIHAGDVGSPAILTHLREIAPVVAVRGNVDVGDWARELPVTAVADVGGSSFYVLHNIDDLDLDPAAAGFAAVVYGHSHKPVEQIKSGVLYINPGSVGPRRFKLPITMVRLDAHVRPFRASFIEISS